MGFNGCSTCGPGSPCRGSGVIADPERKWWQILKTITCPDCLGDGFNHPPGWPDEVEMNRLRPIPPPAPPRK